ncbi:MAG: hypothetical protein FWG90_13050 [Oscillospiraceae bacterium]|nr:hypothetical protein [Oscillospiraceae bacterium]
MKNKYLLYALKPDEMSGFFFHFVLLLSVFVPVIITLGLEEDVSIIGIYVLLTLPFLAFLLFMTVCSCIKPKKIVTRMIVGTILSALYVVLYGFLLIFGISVSGNDMPLEAKMFILVFHTVTGGIIIVHILGIIINYNRYAKIAKEKQAQTLANVEKYILSKFETHDIPLTLYFKLNKREADETIKHYCDFEYYEIPFKENKRFPIPLQGDWNGHIVFPKNAYDNCCVDIYGQEEDFVYSVFIDNGELTDDYEKSREYSHNAKRLSAEMYEYLENKYPGIEFGISDLITLSEQRISYIFNDGQNNKYADLSGDVSVLAAVVDEVEDAVYEKFGLQLGDALIVSKTGGEFSDEFEY